MVNMEGRGKQCGYCNLSGYVLYCIAAPQRNGVTMNFDVIMMVIGLLGLYLQWLNYKKK